MELEAYEGLYRLEDSHWWFRGRRTVIAALFGRAELPSSPRLLDAGCGTGRNLLELGRLGDAVGVDVSPEAIDFCHKRGLREVQLASLTALPFEAASFDAILVADVLEHVEDDLGALRELRRVSADDAVLVATVPAYEWLWSQHDVFNHHFRRYTRPMLVERVRAAGWEPKLATYFNSVLLPPIAAVRKLGRLIERERPDLELTPGPLNGLLQLPMQAEARVIANGLVLPFGVSIGVLCRPSDRSAV